MYAVIKTGGKQYRVAAGDKLKVEQIPTGIGEMVTLDQVLSVSSGEKSLIGEPLVSGATVSATVVDQGKAAKIRIFKMRRRKHYRKTQGHRQLFTELFISKIASSLGEATADAQDALDFGKRRRARIAAASLPGDEAAAVLAAAGVGAAGAGAGGSSGSSAASSSAASSGPATASGSGASTSEATAGSGSSQAVGLMAAAGAAGSSASAGGDDLTKIEGVGPKIGELLAGAGITTFAQLADAKPDALQKILVDGGPRFAVHNPTTWPEQARLAADGQWDELTILQNELDGGVRVEPDDLTKIEGIGLKINELLQTGGVRTFKQLAEADIERLKKILAEAGSRFEVHNPATWPQQARLAADGKWDELTKLQDELDGGRPA